ncbi:MAG: tetratricopeptide repeat protein, partial [Candidatus Obscuribacterales bacterium]|nr:tetratricopeptide repeat protein [Candidatus Obscuribacterales bacterium]
LQVSQAISGLLNVIRSAPSFGPSAVPHPPVPPPEQIAHWEAQYDQGRALLHDRHYLSAANIFEETLEQARQLFTFPDHRLFENLFNLAHAQMKLGRYKHAESNMKESIKIAEAALGSDSGQVNLSRMCLAIVLGYQEKYDEAKLNFERAKIFVENDPEMIPDYLKLKEVFEEMMKQAGSLTAAEAMVKQAIDVQSKGQSEQAEASFQTAISILEKAFGADHKYTSKIRQYLAKLYFECGQVDKATQYTEAGAARGQLQIAQAIANEQEGYKHLEAGNREEALLKFMEARQQYLSGISALEVWLGPDDQQLAVPLCYYASLLRELGWHVEADNYEARGQMLMKNNEQSL